jgi:hypothetical protein
VSGVGVNVRVWVVEEDIGVNEGGGAKDNAVINEQAK